MELHVAATSGVLLPHPPVEATDLGDISPMFKTRDDQGKSPEENACDLEAAHQEDWKVSNDNVKSP
jgi:hypothetical protein